MARTCAVLFALLIPLTAAAGDGAADDPLKGLSYRQIGPNINGRATQASGVEGDPLTWYLAAAQGGIWKSGDGGHHWDPIFDEMPSQSVGALAVAPSDSNVIYVGGGEGNIRGNVQPGQGLFVSTDAGQTWQHTLKLRAAVGQIAVDPYNSDVAYAAVLGSPFKAGKERGIYRTQDSGQSWEAVLTVDADTGASDVSIDANNPRIVWAGTWQTRRTPWGLHSGGAGSGLWRSADGGSTWTRLKAGEHGLPKGEWGKVGVAVSPSDGDRIYALIEAEDGGLYRSDDAGKTFSRVNDHWALRQRAWYYSTITADPNDPDIAWLPQVRMLRTRDGGKTLEVVEGFAHGDHHDVWIDPSDSNRVIAAHDGGVDLTVDGGGHWHNPALPLGQFYNIDVDQRVPYHVGGTLQDMGTVSGPSISLAGDGTALADWRYVGGGEAGDFRYDLELPGVVYAGEYGGYLSRYAEGSGQYRNISAKPENPSGIPPKEQAQRFQWTAPVELSPHDPATIYHGANVLYRSRDRGESWTAISGDLTRNDKNKQEWSGGPITGDNTGVEIYGTIFAIDESPLTRGEIWTGSDDGLIHVSRDDGASFGNVTPKDLPIDATVESLRASRHQVGRVYVVAHRYRLGDDRPFVFVSDDHGQRWRSLTATLPVDMPTYSIVEDERDARTLYLGAERALFVSTDAGAHWREVQLNLPRVAVVDLEAAHGDLIIGTRGRVMWAFDDVELLKQALARSSETAWLAPASRGTRWRGEGRWADSDGSSNPAYGALISYYLPTAIEGELKLRITDAKGLLVRELSSKPLPADGVVGDADGPNEAPKPELETGAGWHRVAWDLRHHGAELLTAKIDYGAPSIGPLAAPGQYRAELIGAGTILTASIEVLADPRSPADAAAMQANLDFGLQLRGDLDRTRAGIELLRAAREQASELRKRLADQSAFEAVIKACDAVIADADRIEGELHNPEAKVVYDILRGPRGARLYSQLAPLYSWSQDSDLAPTAAMRARHTELAAELAEREAAIGAMRKGSIQALETAVSAAALPRLILPAQP